MKRCSIDSTQQIKLSCTKAKCRGHGVKSRAKVSSRAGVMSNAGDMQVVWSDLHLQINGIVIVQIPQKSNKGISW